MASLDEASKCPICKEPGNKYEERSSGNAGNKVLMYRCTNTTCRWGQDPEDMGWIVEVDSSGAIAERKAHDKQFPSLKPPPEAIEHARRVGEQLAKPTNDLKNTPEIGTR